jgi:hypothetical protein
VQALPIVWVADKRSILLLPLSNDERFGFGGRGWLVEPPTGELHEVAGDFRVFEFRYAKEPHIVRPLQPALRPGRYWAAMPEYQSRITQIGLYDVSSFRFTPIVEVPELAFDSQHVWVDEPAGKAYFVYGGHLLRVTCRSGAGPAHAS